MSSDSDGTEYEDTLLELSAQDASGRLLLSGADGHYGWVWLRDGSVSGASGPGPRPLLANRLLTFGMMPRARIAKLIAETRARPGARLFDMIMSHQMVPSEFLMDFVAEATAEQLLHVNTMGVKGVAFENGRIQRAGPILVATHRVIDAAHQQRTEIPDLPGDALFIASDPAVSLPDPVSRAIAARSDGNRSARQLADACGLTLNETLNHLERMLIAEDLAIASSAPTPEPWQVQRPMGGTQTASEPSSGSRTSPGAVSPESAPAIPPKHPHPEATSALQEAARDAGAQGSDTREGDRPQAQAAEAAESAGGISDADRARFSSGMRTARSATETPEAPPPPNAPAPPSPIEKVPNASPPTTSANERRDLFSTLSALSSEIQDPSDPGPESETASRERSQPPAQDDASEYAQPKRKSNPGAATEMFSELRSLAHEAEENEDKKRT